MMLAGSSSAPLLRTCTTDAPTARASARALAGRRAQMATMALTDAARVLRGERPLHPVNEVRP